MDAFQPQSGPEVSLHETIMRALPGFFREATLVVGTEKTYHALFTHHLYQVGMPRDRVAREVALEGRKKVDVVVFEAAVRGDFSLSESARVAVEFKGGAYGNRNALSDTVKPDSSVEDIDKLAALPEAALARWFICVDLPRLGRALGEREIANVASLAASKGVNFAYGCAGEEVFWVRPQDGDLHTLPLATMPDEAGSPKVSSGLFAHNGQLARWLNRHAAGLRGSEDVLVSQVYHALRKGGFRAQQVSLETYFSFAAGKNRMQYRPDLCLFGPGVGGNFNLYRAGQRSDSNDALKLHQLRAIVEVKGSVASARQSDRRLHELFSKDLDKLVMWQTRAKEAAQQLGVGCEFQSVFVGAYLRERPLAGRPRVELEARATENGIQYLHLDLSS